MWPKIYLIAAIAVCTVMGFVMGRISLPRTDQPFADHGEVGLSRVMTQTRPGPRFNSRPARHERSRPVESHPQSSAYLHLAPTAAMQAIINNQDPIDRTREFLQFVEGLGPIELKALVGAFNHDQLQGINSVEYRILLAAWAGKDPQAAANYAKETQLTPNEGQAIMAAWARNDPTAAFNWAKENHQGGELNQWMIGVINGTAVNDPELATHLINALPASKDYGTDRYRETAVCTVMNQYIKMGPKVARDRAMSFEDEELRAWATEWTAYKLAGIDPKGTADWLIANSLAPDNLMRLDSMVRAMVHADSKVAIDYMSKVSDQNVKRRALHGIVRVLSSSDPEDALLLIDAHPEVADDHVMNTFISRAGHKEPVLAADAINRIKKTDLQDRAYETHLSNWLRTDFNAAIAWLNRNELPENVARSVEALIVQIQNP